MSPRLLHLLTTLHTHHPFARRRDWIDAQLAETRLSPVPADYVLLEAA